MYAFFGQSSKGSDKCLRLKNTIKNECYILECLTLRAQSGLDSQHV